LPQPSQSVLSLRDKQKTTDFALHINPDQKRYWPGDDVKINARLKNAGKTPVRLWERELFETYQFDIVLPNGARAELTAEAKRWIDPHARSFSVASSVFDPGEVAHFTISGIVKQYDMTQEGVCQITISRMVPKRSNPKELVKLTSNTIRIGIGEIPEGALDEKPDKAPAPPKAAPAKKPTAKTK